MSTRRAACFAAVLLSLTLGCGPTEVLVGDAPGLARLVAGIQDKPADATASALAPSDALTTALGEPDDVAGFDDGSFYFADRKAQRIGHVGVDGVVSWPVGRGLCASAIVVDPDPLKVCLIEPVGLALEPSGSLLIADRHGHRVYRYDPAASTITAVLGTGRADISPDSTPALQASINQPMDVAVAPDGTFDVVDFLNSRVVQVDSAGLMRVVAGNGDVGDTGDGGPARLAQLAVPEGIAFMGDTLYISDSGNGRVRRIINDTIFGYAGVGAPGFSGDNHSVSLALFDHPSRLSTVGDLLFVTDRGNHRVRLIRVGPDSIATFAGTGSAAPSLDLVEAARTNFSDPVGVSAAGRAVFIADAVHVVIRRVVR